MGNGSLTKKTIGGRPYDYMRFTARVNGRPKVVRTVYMGKPNDILTAVQGYRKGQRPKSIVLSEFGAVAAVWSMIRRTGLVELIDDLYAEQRFDHVFERDQTLTGQTAVVLAIENGQAIEDDLGKLEQLRRRGVRSMTLTHAKDLSWAASSGEGRGGFGGLTPFGEKVVTAMNEMDMVIDVSHVHESTFWAVVKHSRKPIIASHSNATALCPMPRNLTDDQLRTIADSGGMVGVNFFPGFLDTKYTARFDECCGDQGEELGRTEREYRDNSAKKLEAFDNLFETVRRPMQPFAIGAERIVDHIECMVRVAGDECVGFGADLDGISDLPEGMSGCGDHPTIVELMRKRGLSESSIEKTCFGNALRVFGG